MDAEQRGGREEWEEEAMTKANRGGDEPIESTSEGMVVGFCMQN